jgi:hypothetical protein
MSRVGPPPEDYRTDRVSATPSPVDTSPSETDDLTSRGRYSAAARRMLAASPAPGTSNPKPLSTAPPPSVSTSGQAEQLVDSSSSKHVSGLRKWEGRIIEVVGNEFSAELSPIDRPGPTLIADFAKNLLDSDEGEIREGDVFYLTTRMVRTGRRNTPTSSLKMRRLGHWSEADLIEAREEARQIASDLDRHAF